ncbi:glycosyltransferase [Sphingobacterium sp. IITKGP-BTPF85]|nr:glycosyltransferase [Sphingobacterium sp. IITKGP-BTPF85]
MKMKNTKILVCTHKESLLPQHPNLLPIQVGSAISNKKLLIEQDNTGENISNKNPNYCELTAHYWAWKNLKNVDIIGLNHYRRYFDFDKKYKFFAPDRSFIATEEFIAKPFLLPDLNTYLQSYDIILPKKRHHPYTIETMYLIEHIKEDWEILKNVIIEKSPDYRDAFNQTMIESNNMANYNMFITSWKYFDLYSNWLFMILEEMEKRILISLYPAQSRIFGYISERLINVFCKRHNLKIMYVPVIMLLDEMKPHYNPSNLRYTLRSVKNDLKFIINR